MPNQADSTAKREGEMMSKQFCDTCTTDGLNPTPLEWDEVRELWECPKCEQFYDLPAPTPMPNPADSTGEQKVRDCVECGGPTTRLICRLCAPIAASSPPVEPESERVREIPMGDASYTFTLGEWGRVYRDDTGKAHWVKCDGPTSNLLTRIVELEAKYGE